MATRCEQMIDEFLEWILSYLEEVDKGVTEDQKKANDIIKQLLPPEIAEQIEEVKHANMTIDDAIEVIPEYLSRLSRLLDEACDYHREVVIGWLMPVLSGFSASVESVSNIAEQMRENEESEQRNNRFDDFEDINLN